MVGRAQMTTTAQIIASGNSLGALCIPLHSNIYTRMLTVKMIDTKYKAIDGYCHHANDEVCFFPWDIASTNIPVTLSE